MPLVIVTFFVFLFDGAPGYAVGYLLLIGIIASLARIFVRFKCIVKCLSINILRMFRQDTSYILW